MKFQNRIKEIDILQQEINEYRPFNDHYAKEFKEYFRIGLTYSSNAIEGNSLTETETKIILEDGITIGGKSLLEHQEAIGHSNAYDFMFKLSYGTTISENDIRELHRLFYYRIDEKNAGIYRKAGVFISGTSYIPPKPEDVPGLMQRLVERLSLMREGHHPVEYAAMLHGDFVTIHPFIDGNGRTARLLMNLVLLQSGYVIALISPAIRNEYISTLKKYNTGDIIPFINLISTTVYETQKDYLRMIKSIGLDKHRI